MGRKMKGGCWKIEPGGGGGGGEVERKEGRDR